MFKSLRTLAFATLLPFALPTLAQVNATLPANVQKALQTNKLTGNDLSLVLIPLDGPGNPTYYNADVSVNPASTMKLFTTYAALEMLGPTYQWKTEFYTDGQLQERSAQRQPLPQGRRRSETEHGEALAADARPARQWRDQGHR